MSVFNSVWHLSPSSSKIVKIGLDTQENFYPFLWLSKNGYKPVQLSLSDFNSLVANESVISTFFCNDGEVSECTSIDLTSALQVRFDKSYVCKMVVIERQLSGTAKTSCWLSDKTWFQFVDLFQCILYELNKLNECFSDMPRLIDAITLQLKTTQAGAVVAAFSKNDRDIIMKKLQVEDVPFVSDFKFDVKRAIFELSSLCSNYLLFMAKKLIESKSLSSE